jgi:hypothetical protein
LSLTQELLPSSFPECRLGTFDDAWLLLTQPSQWFGANATPHPMATSAIPCGLNRFMNSRCATGPLQK